MKIPFTFRIYFTNFFSYVLAAAIPLGLSILTNPLMALNLDPEDYAIIGYFTSFGQLFTPLIIFSLATFYVKDYFKQSEEERRKYKATILRSMFAFSGFLTLVCLLILYIYHTNFNKDSNIELFPYAFYSLISIPLTGILSLQLLEYKITRASKKFFVLSVITGLTNILLTIIFVVVLKMGADGKFIAILLSNLILFFYCLYINKQLFMINFDWQIFKRILKFCTPLSLAAMLDFFSSGYDRVVLERNGNLVELGIYVVALQIAGYLNIFTTAITDTFQPDIFKYVSDKKIKNVIKVAVLNVSIVIIFILIFISIAPYVISLLTAGRYVQATQFTIILALSSITKSINSQISTLTIALGATVVSLYTRIISSLLLILIFNFLIIRWGFGGAAWGIVLSYIILMIVNCVFLKIWYNKKIYYI